jgi:hypothetical protein
MAREALPATQPEAASADVPHDAPSGGRRHQELRRAESYEEQQRLLQPAREPELLSEAALQAAVRYNLERHGRGRHKLGPAALELLQRRLEVPPSGQLDEATTQATARFQQRSGLKVDGKIGPQTEPALLQPAESPGKPDSEQGAPPPEKAVEQVQQDRGASRPQAAQETAEASATAPGELFWTSDDKVRQHFLGFQASLREFKDLEALQAYDWAVWKVTAVGRDERTRNQLATMMAALFAVTYAECLKNYRVKTEEGKKRAEQQGRKDYEGDKKGLDCQGTNLLVLNLRAYLQGKKPYWESSPPRRGGEAKRWKYSDLSSIKTEGEGGKGKSLLNRRVNDDGSENLSLNVRAEDCISTYQLAQNSQEKGKGKGRRDKDGKETATDFQQWEAGDALAWNDRKEAREGSGHVMTFLCEQGGIAYFVQGSTSYGDAKHAARQRVRAFDVSGDKLAQGIKTAPDPLGGAPVKLERWTGKNGDVDQWTHARHETFEAL